MDTFETVIIFRPEVNLQEKLKEYEQLFKTTTDHIYVNPMGIRKLAYGVRGCNKGHYVSIYYNSTPQWINTDLDLKIRKDDDALKFMTIKMTEKPEDLVSYTRISLTEQDNKHIDAMDVLLGLTSYYKKEVI